MRQLIVLLCTMRFLEATMIDKHFDMAPLDGKKIAYYIGSFDPIHLGHQNIIESALDFVDYVLVYPAPGDDPFKNRTDVKVRQKMIDSIYKDHPNVLVTHLTPIELQQKFRLSLPNIEIIGLIGSDIVTESLLSPDESLRCKYQKVFMRGVSIPEKHHHGTIGALMALKADSFLVALRGDVDFTSLNGMIEDRPIKAFIQSNTISSTKARKAISEGESCDEMLAPSVINIINQEGLYKY